MTHSETNATEPHFEIDEERERWLREHTNKEPGDVRYLRLALDAARAEVKGKTMRLTPPERLALVRAAHLVLAGEIDEDLGIDPDDLKRAADKLSHKLPDAVA